MSIIEANDPLQAVRDHVVKAMVTKAVNEPDYRDLLKADPHEALTVLLERENPMPHLKINVIEEKPGEVTVVLPAPMQRDELPDELLDLASGGTSFSAFILYGPPYPDKKPKR